VRTELVVVLSQAHYFASGFSVNHFITILEAYFFGEQVIVNPGKKLARMCKEPHYQTLHIKAMFQKDPRGSFSFHPQSYLNKYHSTFNADFN